MPSSASSRSPRATSRRASCGCTFRGRAAAAYRYALAFDDTTDPADTVLDADGIALAIDERSKPYLEGATIDFVDALMGGGFMVRNASLEGSCACGRR